jgi:glucokinase
VPYLMDKGIALLGSAAINMQSAATTTIYTTPVGKVTRISHAVVRDPSASLAGGTSYTITGLRAAFSLDALRSATGFVCVHAVNDLTAEQLRVAAATAVQLTVTTGSTAAASATIDVFGYTT